ncbi:hypothetical protein ACSSS7_000155 [Eimeria intestinalis]
MEASVPHWRHTNKRIITCSRRRGPPPLLQGGPRVSSAAARCLLLLLLLGFVPLGILFASSAGGPHAVPAAAAESAGAPHPLGPSWAPSLHTSLLLGGPWREQEKAAPSGSAISRLPAAAAIGLRDSEDEAPLEFPLSLQTLISVSFACLVGCLVSFCFLSASHLHNYYEPKLQRMVCRIGCALPLFALLSTAACFSVFSELRALHGATIPPYGALGNLNQRGAPPPSPSPAPGSSTPVSSVATQIAITTASPAAGVLVAAGEAERGLEGVSTGGPHSNTVQTSWLEGAPLRELSAADVLSGAHLGAPSRYPLSSVAPPALPSLSRRPTDRLEEVRGPPFNASEGGPLTDENHHFRQRRPYYLQQQLFFELGKQLTQSTALYSFSSLMVNACGGYRCLSLTLGCDGHSVPYVFPLSLLLRPFLPNPKALRLLKLGVMQFVLVLPLWTAATLMADNSSSRSDSFTPKKTHLERAEETIPGGEKTIPQGAETASPSIENRKRDKSSWHHLRGAASQPQTNSFEDTMAKSLNATPEETIPGETIPEETAEEEDPVWISRQFVLQAVLGLILSLSMFASMMSLSQFYLITRPYLSPYSPEEKFLLIQLLVFTNSWQRLIVGLVGTLWGLPGALHTAARDGLLDVCFSVDLIADAHEAVLAPQMSLDRAFSLLHQQTISHQAFLQEWTEMEDAEALQTPHTATSPQHEGEQEGGAPLLPHEHATTGGPQSPWGPLEPRPPTAEGGPTKPDEAPTEVQTSRGPLRRGDSRATAGTRRSYWGPLLPWGPIRSPSLTSSHLPPRRMATVSVYSNSSSLHPTSAAAAAAAAAALAEAATIGSYRSKRAREAARARISALACPTSPYSTDLTAALAIALGDAAPAFPVSISLLSRRLAAMSLTRSNSISSTPAPPAPPSVAPLRKWASGGPPGGLQKKYRGRGGAPPYPPRRSASARRLRKPSAEVREGAALPGAPQETPDSVGPPLEPHEGHS